MAKNTAHSPQGQLNSLKRKVLPCTLCPELVEHRTQPVFGGGDPQSLIVLVGEAPGRNEDEWGEPFVGLAGRRLNELLTAGGLRREDVYITNAAKCRPPANRTPKDQEIENCRPYLVRQLAIIKPATVCALGRTAARSLLGGNETLGAMRGKVHTSAEGWRVICTYHPAYIRRNPAAEPEFLKDLKLLVRTARRVAKCPRPE